LKTLREHLESAQRQLGGQGSTRLEAEILMAHCLESQRSFLYANPELELPRKRVAAFARLIERRLRGEPIAYIIGVREFWSLPLSVTPDVLIPRPETELLVETALQAVPPDAEWRIADLGTGSGAIALALAAELPGCEVHATDISEAALQVAMGNAGRLGLERVTFHRGSWCEPLTGKFQLIVSNPPYVAIDDPHLRRGDCRFEPRDALSPGSDALGAARAIVDQSRAFLVRGGWLLLEHGLDQGEEIRATLRRHDCSDVATLRDLLGHERVTRGRKPA
jgi:release factor glutamine methyltransferase